MLYLNFFVFWVLAFASETALACLGNGHHGISHVQVQASPAKTPPKTQKWKKIALKNVKVFDGTTILPPSTVIIDGPRIGLNGNITVDKTIDGNGGVLIPGLIESHAHPGNITHLEQLVSYGVTTVMSMACVPETSCNTLRGQTGLADFYSAGILATSPNSTHAKLQGAPDQLINSPADASWFVSNRMGNGSDFIKVIAEADGMNQQELDTLVSTSHASGMQVMSHITLLDSYKQAISSGADNIQHISSDAPITADMAQKMIANNQISTPTLTISKQFIEQGRYPTWNFSYAQEGIRVLKNAGVPILAGTDNTGGDPANGVPPGSSLLGELELLNQAGMSTLEVLTAATKRPAHAFGLWDRGVIKPGYRADLVLIRGDPLANISNTRNIERVWASGLEYNDVAKSRKH